MKTYFLLVTLLLALPLQAAEPTPSWTELEALFGEPVQGAPMQKFVKAHGLSEAIKGDSGNFTPHDQSYAINFEGNRVACVVLHVGTGARDYGDSHWMGYDSELPFGLKRLYARKDVIALLGDPDIPSGNFWQLRTCELRVSFSKSTGLIEELYVWKKSKSPQKKTT